MSTLSGVSPHVADRLRPRPFLPAAEWAAQNITLPKGSEIRGKFRLDLFPHVVEPLAAFDDPAIRSITLQWASRCGKTAFMQAVLAKVAACDPHPMALADADEKSTKRVLKRLWRVLENVPALADQIPPRRLQASDKIELRDCLIHGAWSGSPTTAADYAAYVVCLNELDKMSKRVSDEADFAFLMEERAKGFRGSKVIRVSTPSLFGESRIEAARLAGDNRQRYVPCPFCNHWQTLRTGNKTDPGGLKWDKLPSGHSDPALALETAWYQCEACEQKILDEHRYELLNAGLWIPAGQTVSGSGVISGQALKPGPDASFGPLPTLYSLLPAITWGVIAKAFLDSRPNAEKRRNYTNSWESQTHNPAPPAASAHEVAERLCVTEAPREVCPPWARFVTVGIDVQDQALPWMAICWGEHCRGHALAWGRANWLTPPAEELGEVLTQAIRRTWQHADGGPPLSTIYTLIDSGDQTARIYALCDKYRWLDPAKGSSTDFPEHYRFAHRGGERAARPKSGTRPAGGVLIELNSDRSQFWIEGNLTREIAPGMHGYFTLPEESRYDLELLDQLLNETKVTEHFDGKQKVTWRRRDHHAPNDYRDVARLAWAAAQVVTRGKWERLPPRTPPAAEPDPPTVTMPDGRPFLINER